MFAIFEHGGKQYKVSVGETIALAKIDLLENETIVFKQVLLTADGDNIEIGQPFVNTVVEAKILTHGRDDKIRVVKQKAKKRYHKVQGHRQDFTKVKIIRIGDIVLTETSSSNKKSSTIETEI